MKWNFGYNQSCRQIFKYILHEISRFFIIIFFFNEPIPALWKPNDDTNIRLLFIRTYAV